jgi:guanylate kinase
MTKGPLLILSGPSGSGKSTVIQRLLAASGLPLRLSVSATTRAPRPGEVDGVHYWFWTREQFEAERAAGAFLEWAEVHGRDYYGTLRREVDPYREQGLGVILDIDVQGAEQVRRQCPDAVTVFLRTSTLAALEERLRQRGTEAEEAVRRRLANAARELARRDEYAYQVVNDDLNDAVAELTAIVRRLFEGGGHAG